jgi:hypothetical protein
MSFRLPAKTNPLRALFDLDTLVKIESRELVVTMFDARGSARRLLESNILVQSVAFVIVEANGMVSLIAFERNRDYPKTLWNFGKAWETIKI